MKFCESTEKVYKEIAKDFTLIIKMKGDDKGSLMSSLMSTLNPALKPLKESPLSKSNRTC